MHNVLIKLVESNQNDEQNAQKYNSQGSSEPTLYQVLEDQGKALPHGCLAGSCGACRVEIIAGEELLKKPTSVEADTLSSLYDAYAKSKGPDFAKSTKLRLSCRAKIKADAQGTIEIKPIK